jgi:4-hydroxyphenylacetate decarboxylase small subunit
MEKCNDCRYYLPVDVFKGLCKVSKEKKLPESQSCKEYERIAKCKFCKNYANVKDNIGTCMGKTDAYPEMLAITCIDYSRKS